MGVQLALGARVVLRQPSDDDVAVEIDKLGLSPTETARLKAIWGECRAIYCTPWSLELSERPLGGYGDAVVRLRRRIELLQGALGMLESAMRGTSVSSG